LVTPGTTLFLQGVQQGGTAPQSIGQLAVTVDPNQGVQSTTTTPPVFTPYDTPSDCTSSGNNINRLCFAPDGAAERYAVTCDLPNSVSSLWVGGSAIAPIEVVTGPSNGLGLSPDAYAYVSGMHFLAFQAQTGIASGGYSYGTPNDLGFVTPFALVADQSSIPFSLAPLPTNDGFALFLASVATGFSSASLWGGPVHTTDFASLGMTPPPDLKQLVETSNVTSFGGLGMPTADADTLYLAGSNIAMNAVNLSWTLRDGTPLLLEFPVYTTTTTTVVAAAAAPLAPETVVVWIEYTSTMSYSVSAQKLLCAMTGG
jgi:hypothetical protein